MKGNPYLIQTIKNPDMIYVREAEVMTLRELLDKARAETIECYAKIKRLETALYMLSSSVLAGEIEKAQEYAYLAQKLLRGE
ncbi:MAG: hypothetical protein DRP29_09785 [Thermodesulfobacteriota bacterium]|nr:MAG: hypothetical protein DRP29_09785 [Thermodesulfobacteriota bacterium]